MIRWHFRFAPLLVLILIVQPLSAQDTNVDLPRYPSISPDGSEVVFSWRGDLWKVPAEGGTAKRITSHTQDELYSAWSRDGRRIAFTSTRTGSTNVHMMNSDGTALRQVTDFDRPVLLTGFGVDDEGNEVLTLAARPDPDWFPGTRVFMVSVKGGDLIRIHGAYGTFPVLSPDSSKVLFNRGSASWNRRGYRGPDSRDVWLYDRAEDTFQRLTQWEGNDGRARWIDDDSYVYASDRQDNTVNLYRLKLGQDERQAIRLTRFNDADVEDFDISADGKTLVFAKWNRLYTLDLTKPDAQPKEMLVRASEDDVDRYRFQEVSRQVGEVALSPDGKTMAYIAYGEVFVRGTEKNSPTRRVTATAARERDIAWSPDGLKLYFSSDDSGNEAIYAATVRLTRSEVRAGYDDASKPTEEPGALPTTQPAEEAEEPQEPQEAESADEQPAEEADEIADEPPTTDPATTEPQQGEPTTEPTTEPATAPATQPAHDPARWTDAIAFDLQLVLSSDDGDRQPVPSPDGKWLSFRRGVGNLMLMDLATEEVRPVVENWSASLDWRFSPDARWIAYVTEDINFNSDIWIVPTDASAEPVNVTRHPDNEHSPRWSADGRKLAFLSQRVNDEYDVWMVWLDKEMETLTPVELDQYYKEAIAAAKKREPLKPASAPATTRPTTAPAARRAGSTPTTQREARPPKEQLDLDDAWLRLRRITTLPGHEGNLELTPGGDKYIFTATVGTQRGLFSLDRDGNEPRRLGSAANVQHLSLSGEQIVVVEGNRGGLMNVARGETEWLDISDRIRIDLAEQSSQKFLEAARILGSRYYDPKMNGLDWNDVTRRYYELARGARTADEFNHVAAKLLGELNGSHLGINSPDSPNPLSRPYGKLGITTEPAENGYRVTQIMRDGPAEKTPTPLRVGDVITAVNLETFAEFETLDSKLAGMVDREVILTIVRTGDDGVERELTALITPISFGALSNLFYNNWRLDMVRRVEELSDGQIGYIHIQSMNQPSLDVFERDLYAAAEGKKGLIIDVRNNGGGWTTDRLLASIMYPRHAYTVARGQDSNDTHGYPQDRLFIQRFDGPINMLCNEKSFSNAEIISHAFKTLKRGTLVGQQTAGGVISTGGTRLIDGTTVRIPFRGWFLPDGTNMENNGAMPDILVIQTPEDEVAGRDPQLKSAVEDLLKRIE